MSEKITSDLQELGLSVRVYNALMRVNITRIADLAQLTEEDLLRIPNIGALARSEIKSRLGARLVNKSALPRDDAVTGISALAEQSTREDISGLASEDPIHRVPIANVQFVDLESNNDRLENLSLSRKALRLLHRANIRRISQLVKLSDKQILNLRGSGPITLVEIHKQLQTYAANSEKPRPPSIVLVDAGNQSPVVDPISGQSDVLSNLTANQRQAIELSYGLVDGRVQSLEEVANKLGVSREEARQLQTCSLAKIAKLRSFQAGLAALRQAIKELGGLATSDEVRANLEALTSSSANPAGIARFLEALGISIAFYKIHDRLILILENDGGRQQFAYLEKGCLLEIRRYDSTYQANDLLASLKRRIDHPHLLPDDFALAFLRVHPMFEKQIDGSLSLAAWVSAKPGKLVAAPAPPPPSKKPAVHPVPLPPPPVPRQAVPSASVAPPPAPRQAKPKASLFELFQKLTKNTNALDDWEAILCSKVAQAGLIGEIPITSEQCAQLGKLLGDLMYRMHSDDSPAVIENLYPTTLACFLVGQGVNGYQQGGYWPAVEQALGFKLDGNWRAILGQIFERFLERKNLPLFPEMRLHSSRYMSLILAHGGIPTYCLGDFFHSVVKPSPRPILANYPVEARLGEVLPHYTGDRPVKYFLENGGAVALDFYQRSCDLVQEWYATGEVPAAEAIGLPEHVLAYFRSWVPENLKPATRERDASGRLRRPELVVDAWGSGLVLHLPAQPVPVTTETTATWTLQELQRTVSVRISFGKTAEIDVPILQPLERYSVTLQLDDKTYSWAVEGFRAAEPIMVFSPGSGRWQARLTADPLWVFYPRSYSLEPVEGSADLAEELLDLSGGWRGQAWDLRAALVMGLRQPNGEVLRLGIRLSEQNKPSLLGTPRLASSGVDGQIDIFTGRPPDVRIPLPATRASNETELQRWVLTVRALDLRPEQFRRAVSDIDPAALAIQDNAAIIQLAHSSLLGPQPFGTYAVKLSGPIGRDAHFVIGCLPELQVRGLDELLVPHPKLGPLLATAQIELTPSEDLELADESRGLAMRQSRANVNEINIPGNIRQLRLAAVRALENGAEKRVPFTLTLRRLQWRIIGGEAATSDWTGQALRLPTATLLNEPAAALLIDLPGIEANEVQLTLRLIDVDGEACVSLAVGRQRRAPYWRFELAQLHDTLRALPSPALRLELECTGLPGEAETLHLPVLEINRDLLIEHIQGHWQKTPEGRHLRLSWHEDRPVKSRLLLLWPAWRPWEPPTQWPIPDSAQGEVELFLPNDRVPPGNYRLSIVAKTPWADDDYHQPLEQGRPGTFDLLLAAPESRLADLDAVTNLGQAFENDLERACISRATGALDASDLNWCCTHLELARPRQLVTLCQLVEDSRSAEIQSEFGRQLFQPASIERVSGYFDNRDISEDALAAFSRMAPRPEQWPEDVRLALAEGPYPQLRLPALQQLASAGLDRALPSLLKAVTDGRLSEDEFVQLVSDDKYAGLDALNALPSSSLVRRLTKLLEGFSIQVRPLMWLESDAGFGRIKRIEDLDDKTSVDQFFEGDGAFLLHVALHVELDRDLNGEAATVNMRTREIRFPRAKSLFVCARCGFISGKLDFYRSHLFQFGCGGAQFVPPQPNQAQPITRLKFFNTSKQTR